MANDDERLSRDGIAGAGNIRPIEEYISIRRKKFARS